MKRELRKNSAENIESKNENLGANTKNFINYLKQIGVIEQFSTESTFL